MSQINYLAMTNKELRKYFIKHREDKTALQAYLDRLSERSDKKVITTVDDLILMRKFKQLFVSR